MHLVEHDELGVGRVSSEQALVAACFDRGPRERPEQVLDERARVERLLDDPRAVHTRGEAPREDRLAHARTADEQRVLPREQREHEQPGLAGAIHEPTRDLLREGRVERLPRDRLVRAVPGHRLALDHDAGPVVTEALARCGCAAGSSGPSRAAR